MIFLSRIAIFLLCLLLFPLSHLSGTVYATAKMRVEIGKSQGWFLKGDLQFKQGGFLLSASSLLLPDSKQSHVTIDDLLIESEWLDISAKRAVVTRDFKEMSLQDGYIFFNGFSFVLRYGNIYLDDKIGFFVDGILFSDAKHRFIGNGFISLSDNLISIKNMEKKVIYSLTKEKLDWDLFK